MPNPLSQLPQKAAALAPLTPHFIKSSSNKNVKDSPNNIYPRSASPLEKSDSARLVIIVWEVSHNYSENTLSATAFASANLHPDSYIDNSIRRGLHDIFGLNLGFVTTNSLSCLVAEESTLCQKLGIQVGQSAAYLLGHLRARIDLLIRFGLNSTLPYIDYQRASSWLSALAQSGNDAALMTPRNNSAPFLLFFGTRENAFY